MFYDRILQMVVPIEVNIEKITIFRYTSLSRYSNDKIICFIHTPLISLDEIQS